MKFMPGLSRYFFKSHTIIPIYYVGITQKNLQHRFIIPFKFLKGLFKKKSSYTISPSIFEHVQIINKHKLILCSIMNKSLNYSIDFQQVEIVLIRFYS